MSTRTLTNLQILNAEQALAPLVHAQGGPRPTPLVALAVAKLVRSIGPAADAIRDAQRAVIPEDTKDGTPVSSLPEDVQKAYAAVLEEKSEVAVYPMPAELVVYSDGSPLLGVRETLALLGILVQDDTNTPSCESSTQSAPAEPTAP